MPAPDPFRGDPYGSLRERDAVLAGLVDRIGRPDPFTWAGDTTVAESDFAALVLHITSQQTSTSAATAIFGRIAVAADGPLDATAVLALGPQRLRVLGLSHAKVASLIDLARRISEGALDLTALGRLDDEQVIEALVAVKGVGRWTAEMFLIHQLRRPDVLPAGDLGIRQAVHAGWVLPGLPTEAEVHELGLAWTPYRTYAAALLWRSLNPASRSITDAMYGKDTP